MIKILVIEDNKTFLRMFSQMLLGRFSAITIVEAVDCADAFDKFKTQQFDLVFTDINLPDGNGLECVGKIKILRPETVVVVMSLSDLPEYQFAAIEVGANYFISKHSLNEPGVVNLLDTLFLDLRS